MNKKILSFLFRRAKRKTNTLLPGVTALELERLFLMFVKLCDIYYSSLCFPWRKVNFDPIKTFQFTVYLDKTQRQSFYFPNSSVYFHVCHFLCENPSMLWLGENSSIPLTHPAY